jgi:hypothetical protein
MIPLMIGSVVFHDESAYANASFRYFRRGFAVHCRLHDTVCLFGNGQKKKGAEYFQRPEDLSDEWVKQHVESLVEEQRQEITKKFENCAPSNAMNMTQMRLFPSPCRCAVISTPEPVRSGSRMRSSLVFGKFWR